MKESIEDTPIRIWVTNVQRIKAFTAKQEVEMPSKKNKRKKKIVKPTFNEFLATLLDVYEIFKDSQVYYANELYTDAAEARGQAILKATRTKTPVHLPKKVCIIGDDSL
jgi:hypothetical protein